MSSHTVESTTLETSDGVKLRTRLFKSNDDEVKDKLVIVLVHPYSVLGGCQALLKGIAIGLAEKGYRAVTFDMRGAGRSTGRPSLTGFSEIKDVIAVCKWVCENLSTDRICWWVLLQFDGKKVKMFDGHFMERKKAMLFAVFVPIYLYNHVSAPIAGSAVDEIKEVVGYVSLGYPFGMMASILFGRHHKAILQSPKPKLFVMGTRDGFTSVKQLQNKLRSASGRIETHLIEGAGHFQMEGPVYDTQMVNLILTFIASL
ncbi:hypothetical protein GH714_039473 [Hevea brasiliensis]|uniref:Xaa-Pro dipeptidyl-peptidase-like domain-containing protein n=1 Tax=Hevea brasiliensis TaxID=3981 RepID=A0A6A6MX18_HEVBR|nr:hypothetical protein GH714_039473 [Hevea brasiliensis]